MDDDGGVGGVGSDSMLGRNDVGMDKVVHSGTETRVGLASGSRA